ncbi:hypothetical protein LPJ63_001574 [Coemansia sp. RSA 2711]|nr:hypothetical protein LPJ63_001574 [Coemansia sp. RSA 2711]
MNLDRLPDDALHLVVQYLRSWSYKQDDLRQLAQCSRALRAFAIRRGWEYFALTQVVGAAGTHGFDAVQPLLSRLLITDDEQLTDAQWDAALDVLEPMDWSNVAMFSIELDALCRRRDACMRRILAFAQQRLRHARELWVGLAWDRRVVEAFFGADFPGVRELRMIGKPGDDGAGAAPVRLPAYGELTVMYLDRSAALMTSAVELVRRSRLTLQDLNIDEYTPALGEQLGLRCETAALDYPLLRRLAVSAADAPLVAGDCDGLLVGTRLPALASLYFSEAAYPSRGGANYVAQMPHVRLAGAAWPALRMLAVDALSAGDVPLIGAQMPALQVLSIGALGSDVRLEDAATPSVPADLPTVQTLLATCARLVDLRIETPEQYEDMYNNSPGFAPYYQQQFGAELPLFERPFSPGLHEIAPQPHAHLRHLTLNSSALTFDQLALLLGRLERLNSLEGIVRFTSRYPLTCAPPRHARLSQLSLAHSTQSRYKHMFKSTLLRFLSMLGALRTLEVYGELEFRGIESTVQRLLPGCHAGFYSLIPTWLLDAIDSGEVDAKDIRRRRIKR